VVPAEVFAVFAGAAVLAAGAAAGAAAGFAAGAGAAAGAAAVVEAGATSPLALVFLLLLVAAGAAAVLDAAGAVEEAEAGVAEVSAAAFFDFDFLVADAESAVLSDAAVVSAAAFFDFEVFVVDAESEAAGVDESAAVLEDLVFFDLLAESAELSAEVAFESAAAAFFLVLLFDVPAAVDESSAAVVESVVAFFAFFFVVLVVLSALESLDASCARTCVVNRNKPISAATASIKTLFRLIRFMMILRVRNRFIPGTSRIHLARGS